MWTVGGLAPVTSGVSDGRGGLLGSGTNARLYTTLFSDADAKSKEDVERERFESRISDALHLDRVSRVFEFRDPSTSPTHRLPGPDHRTLWNGTEWIASQEKLSKFHTQPSPI
jgi:meiosis-specific APC/C activator protein AMA1